VWFGLTAVAVALKLTDKPANPGVWALVPVVMFLYLLYADIDHWTSPLVALLWWALPGASLGVAIVLANSAEGEPLLPAGGTAAMLLLTIGTGEALRRRASHERAPANR
jgi:hypothetical protein